VPHVVHPFARADLEPKFCEIADLALANAVPIIKRLGFRSMEEAMKDSLSRIAFFRACNEGFVKAQTSIIDHLSTGTPEHPIPWQEELLFRKLIDAIAWQVIGMQTYIARQLYRDQPLKRWNEITDRENLVNSARHHQRDDFTRFVMINDLSTLIQTGDLLISHPLDHTYDLIELKDGDVNRDAAQILFAKGGPSKDAMDAFFTKYGEKGFKQLERMKNQALRMIHVRDTVNEGESHDPDRKQTITVPEETIELETYDVQLSDLLDKARKRGWAIDIIEECLYVGVFRQEHLLAGTKSYRSWLRRMGFHEQYPSRDLLTAMVIPFAPPLFSREFKQDNVLDLLFGRSTVLIGIHLDKFMELARKAGLPMSWSSRKEAAKVNNKQIGLKVDNRLLQAGEGDRQITVGGGIFDKMFYHGLIPHSAIAMLQRMTQPVSVHAGGVQP